MIDTTQANQELSGAAPKDIIKWALENAKRPLVTTNFGPQEAVILHMVSSIRNDVPVVWVDSGYNTRETYLVAEELISSLSLDLRVYTPRVTVSRWECVNGEIPGLDDPKHQEFTNEFKLFPFKEALEKEQPDVWLTAIRAEQTAHRQGLEVVSSGPNGVIKVAPLLQWTEADMSEYLKENKLPSVVNYYDPTKGDSKRECGLHTQL